MLTPHSFIRRSTLSLFSVALLGMPVSLAMPLDRPETLGNQLSAMASTGLMLAGCQERMQTLNSMLVTAGFSSMRSHLGNDFTMIARWYNPERHTTVLAFAGWQPMGNVFSAIEMASLVRWNEVLGTP
jgi:hypothetical protein